MRMRVQHKILSSQEHFEGKQPMSLQLAFLQCNVHHLVSGGLIGPRQATQAAAHVSKLEVPGR